VDCDSWETVASTPVPGWTSAPTDADTSSDPQVASSLNGTHGEATNSDDVNNIDDALAQMANAQVFDNQPGVGRDRREARNRQRRRPIQNRRADRPDRERPRGIQPVVNEPVILPVVNVPVIEEAPEPPDEIEPEPDEPPRVALIIDMYIPSMGVTELPLYSWYRAMYFNASLATGGFAMLYYNSRAVAGGLGFGSRFLSHVLSKKTELHYNRSALPILAPILCTLAYTGLSILRVFDIDLGCIARFLNLRNVFTTPRFTRISPLRKTLNVTTGLDRTHLALSGYTGIYRGGVYEELVDPSVAKYGTGAMTDCKQGVMAHHMREILKTTYPGTVVNQVVFANTVIYSTAAILELQNTIKSHTCLTKAAYASSSMM